MKVIDLFNLMFGTVSFEISGSNPEAFITCIMRENLAVWSLEKSDACTLRAVCRAAQFKEVKETAHTCGCECTEISENGLPRFLRRYKSRYGLCVGAVLFLGLLCVLSSFIWSVEIVGATSDIQEQTIFTLLGENGLSVGVPVRSVDAQTIRMKVLAQTDEIAYLTVSVTGTRAIVEVSQVTKTPSVASRFLPCNLVAGEDGIVVSVRSYNGPTYVRRGDAVTKGQLLVGGVYDSKVLGYRVVHASGYVMAETLQRFSETVMLDEMTRTFSGRETSVAFVELFGHRFYLSFHPKSPYETYMVREETTPVALDDTVLPFSVGQTVYCETVLNAVEPDRNDMAELCRTRLEEKVRVSLAGQKITDVDETVMTEGDSVTVTRVYTVIRNIAKEQEILE